MPASLPAGTKSLPPLGGRLFVAYKLSWWLLLTAAVFAAGTSVVDANASVLILALRAAKSAVLVSVSWILFRRRPRDPVAALFGISFLLWIISSSGSFATPDQLDWKLLVDRLRFLPFAFGLLLFPDGQWQVRRTVPIAVAIAASFIAGLVEALGLSPTQIYLPSAIACVLVALASLFARYRNLPETGQRQLKWITLGLITGIGLILTARAGASLTPSGAMPVAGATLLEGLFQLGIVVIAMGFLTSLVRYRLYDAEAAISRSAVYAALTLALVATFAACEALVELIGQHYFGSNIGAISGTVAAAVAAALLSPLHHRISRWAEEHFQHDLAVLKRDLPDLLMTLSAGASVKQFARAVLPRIEQAVQSTRMALIVDRQLAATQGIALMPARRLLNDWQPPPNVGAFDRDDQQAFPLSMPLRCPFGTIRGWLLLGPRPDGSFYGKDDLHALADIGRPLQQSLFTVVERQAQQERDQRQIRRIRAALRSIEIELEQLRQQRAA